MQLVEEAVMVKFDEAADKVPIKGYNDKRFRGITTTNTHIEGMLMVNYVMPNYIFYLLGDTPIKKETRRIAQKADEIINSKPEVLNIDIKPAWVLMDLRSRDDLANIVSPHKKQISIDFTEISGGVKTTNSYPINIIEEPIGNDIASTTVLSNAERYGVFLDDGNNSFPSVEHVVATNQALSTNIFSTFRQDLITNAAATTPEQAAERWVIVPVNYLQVTGSSIINIEEVRDAIAPAPNSTYINVEGSDPNILHVVNTGFDNTKPMEKLLFNELPFDFEVSFESKHVDGYTAALKVNSGGALEILYQFDRIKHGLDPTAKYKGLAGYDSVLNEDELNQIDMFIQLGPDDFIKNYGKPDEEKLDNSNERSMIRLEDVHFTSQGMEILGEVPDSGRVVVEAYSFIAKSMEQYRPSNQDIRTISSYE